MNKAKKSQKFAAVFVLICFLSGELFRPAGVMAMPLPVTEVLASAAFQLEIPPELGTVEMLVSGQGPTVIHIQEAHGDYESQKKIESILHFLKDRYGVELLLLEGNAFELHTELLNFFPGREDLNRNILEDLAKKNMASGPEFFLQKSPETQAWGIEDAPQYRENGQAFIQVLTQRTKTERFVNAMDLQIERLTSPYLNKGLRQYLKRLESFEAGITPFEAWILELKDFAGKYLQKDITSPALQLEWPMLVRLFVLKEFEKRLDLNAFQKESPAFLEAVKAIPESILSAIKTHLESSLSQNRLPDPDTSILFENMVAALPADFDYSKFPSVTLFIGHLILQSELKGERLFDEMTQLSDIVVDKLAADPRENEITALLKKHRLLKRLFNLALTAGDYEIFQPLSLRGVPVGNDEAIPEIATAPVGPRNDNGLRPSAFIKQFIALNSDKLVRDTQFEHMDEVDALYDRALDFYQGAKERDGTMLQKIEERIETSGKDRAAVITGGFHAGPFKTFFESKGYNYALITPKMSQVIAQSREAYVGSVLANYIAPLQPAAATYRPAPYVVLTSAEREALGINPEVEGGIRSSMVDIAQRVGLANEKVRGSIQRRRSLVDGLNSAAAKSEVRRPPGDFALRVLRLEFDSLQQELKKLGSRYASRVPLADVRKKIKTVRELLGRDPFSAESSIAVSKALTEVLETYRTQAQLRADSANQKMELPVYDVLSEMQEDAFDSRLERLRSTAAAFDSAARLTDVETTLSGYVAQLKSTGNFGIPDLLNRLRQGFESDGVFDPLVMGRLVMAFRNFYEGTSEADAPALGDFQSHPVARQIFSLSADVGAALEIIDRFIETGDGWLAKELKSQIRENILDRVSRGDYDQATDWATAQDQVLAKGRESNLKWVAQDFPQLRRSLRELSGFLNVAAGRSEVRATRREFLQVLTAGFLSGMIPEVAMSAPMGKSREEMLAGKADIARAIAEFKLREPSKLTDDVVITEALEEDFAERMARAITDARKASKTFQEADARRQAAKLPAAKQMAEEKYKIADDELKSASSVLETFTLDTDAHAEQNVGMIRAQLALQAVIRQSAKKQVEPRGIVPHSLTSHDMVEIAREMWKILGKPAFGLIPSEALRNMLSLQDGSPTPFGEVLEALVYEHLFSGEQDVEKVAGRLKTISVEKPLAPDTNIMKTLDRPTRENAILYLDARVRLGTDQRIDGARFFPPILEGDTRYLAGDHYEKIQRDRNDRKEGSITLAEAQVDAALYRFFLHHLERELDNESGEFYSKMESALKKLLAKGFDKNHRFTLTSGDMGYFRTAIFNLHAEYFLLTAKMNALIQKMETAVAKDKPALVMQINQKRTELGVFLRDYDAKLRDFKLGLSRKVIDLNTPKEPVAARSEVRSKLDTLILSVALLSHGGPLDVVNGTVSIGTKLFIRDQEVLGVNAPRDEFSQQVTETLNAIGKLVENYQAMSSRLEQLERESQTASAEPQLQALEEEYAEWLADFKSEMEDLQQIAAPGRSRDPEFDERVSRVTQRYLLNLAAMEAFLGPDSSADATELSTTPWLRSRVWKHKGGGDYLMDTFVEESLPSLFANESLLHLSLERLVSNAFNAIVNDGLSAVEHKVQLEAHYNGDTKKIEIRISNPGRIEESLISELSTLREQRKVFNHSIGLPFAVRSIQKMGGTVSVRNVLENQRPRVEFLVQFPALAEQSLRTIARSEVRSSLQPLLTRHEDIQKLWPQQNRILFSYEAAIEFAAYPEGNKEGKYVIQLVTPKGIRKLFYVKSEPNGIEFDDIERFDEEGSSHPLRNEDERQVLDSLSRFLFSHWNNNPFRNWFEEQLTQRDSNIPRHYRLKLDYTDEFVYVQVNDGGFFRIPRQNSVNVGVLIGPTPSNPSQPMQWVETMNFKDPAAPSAIANVNMMLVGQQMRRMVILLLQDLGVAAPLDESQMTPYLKNLPQARAEVRLPIQPIGSKLGARQAARAEVRTGVTRREMLLTGAAVMGGLFSSGLSNLAEGASPKSKAATAKEPPVHLFSIRRPETKEIKLDLNAPAASLNEGQWRVLLANSRLLIEAPGSYDRQEAARPAVAVPRSVTDKMSGSAVAELVKALASEKQALSVRREAQRAAADSSKNPLDDRKGRKAADLDEAATEKEAAARDLLGKILVVDKPGSRTVKSVLQELELLRYVRWTAQEIVYEEVNRKSEYQTLNTQKMTRLARDLWHLMGEPDLDAVPMFVDPSRDQAYAPLFARFYVRDNRDSDTKKSNVFTMMLDSLVRQALYGESVEMKARRERLDQAGIRPGLKNLSAIRAAGQWMETDTPERRLAFYDYYAALFLTGFEKRFEVQTLIPALTLEDVGYYVERFPAFQDLRKRDARIDVTLREFVSLMSARKLLYDAAGQLWGGEIGEKLQKREDDQKKKNEGLVRVNPGDIGFYLEHEGEFDQQIGAFKDPGFFQLNSQYYERLGQLQRVLRDSSATDMQKRDAAFSFSMFLKNSYLPRTEALKKMFQDKALEINGVKRSEVRGTEGDPSLAETGQTPGWRPSRRAFLVTLGVVSLGLTAGIKGINDEVERQKAKREQALADMLGRVFGGMLKDYNQRRAANDPTADQFNITSLDWALSVISLYINAPSLKDMYYDKRTQEMLDGTLDFAVEVEETYDPTAHRPLTWVETAKNKIDELSIKFGLKQAPKFEIKYEVLPVVRNAHLRFVNSFGLALQRRYAYKNAGVVKAGSSAEDLEKADPLLSRLRAAGKTDLKTTLELLSDPALVEKMFSEADLNALRDFEWRYNLALILQNMVWTQDLIQDNPAYAKQRITARSWQQRLTALKEGLAGSPRRLENPPADVTELLNSLRGLDPSSPDVRATILKEVEAYQKKFLNGLEFQQPKEPFDYTPELPSLHPIQRDNYVPMAASGFDLRRDQLVAGSFQVAARSEVRGVREAVETLRVAGLIRDGERVVYYDGSAEDVYPGSGVFQRFDPKKEVDFHERGFRTAAVTFNSLELLSQNAGTLKQLIRSMQSGTIYLALGGDILPTEPSALSVFVTQIAKGLAPVLSERGRLTVETQETVSVPPGILKVTFEGAVSEMAVVPQRQLAKAPTTLSRTATAGLSRRSEVRSPEKKTGPLDQPELNFGREEAVLPRPSYAVDLPLMEWIDIERKILALGDPASESGKRAIEELVGILMLNSSYRMSGYFQALYEKLLLTEDWDRYVLDSIEVVIRETARQSVENLLAGASPQQTEGARRRLYELAYILKIPAHFYHNKESPATTERRERMVTQNQLRLMHVHEILMQEINKTLAAGALAQRPGYSLLLELMPVFENKHKLSNYVYHNAKSGRFLSIRQYGLTTSKMEANDEKPTDVFFHDWRTLASIDNSRYHPGDASRFYVRVRKDAPTVHETRIASSEFGDLASDFLGTDIPFEWVELVDPYRPWIAYPIQNFSSLDDFLVQVGAGVAPNGQVKSEVRVFPSNIKALIFMAVLLTGGIYSSRVPADVAKREISRLAAKTVVVTARATKSFRPHVELKVQELAELQTLFDKATASRPLQAVDHRTKVPTAQELLPILAILVKMPSVKVAMTVLDTEGKLPAIIKELERLARKKIMGFQTLAAIDNLVIRSYTGVDPLRVLEGVLDPEVETAFISPDLALAEKTTFAVGAVVYQPKMRVHVGEPALHPDALVAAFWSLLDEKTVQALGFFEAKDLVKGKLASLLRELRSLEAIMAAA